MSTVRVATCVPRQHWMQAEKLHWLDEAIASNPCDIFLLPQEYVGGGSMREICRLKGIQTDDFPVTVEWLQEHVGRICRKHNVHIGFGATVVRDGINTEEYLYFDPSGVLLGSHMKMALPAEDSVLTNGASDVTPEVNSARAANLIEI